ncbi:MAG: tetratricopeptide repeat protein [Acidobacteria bacterium]|nr:tetratricopeptide repeat protein [Acidobacteriota bacterium]
MRDCRNDSVGFRLKGFRLILCAAGLLMLLGNCSASRTEGEEYSRAAEALRSGDYAKARQHFDSALAGKSRQEESRAGLVRTLSETGAYREAAARADEFLRNLSGSALLHLERGRIAKATGDYAAAEKHFRRSRELASQQDVRLRSTRELGDLLELVGRSDDARLVWENLIAEYRQGKVKGSGQLGDAAVAAWRRGYVHDARDIFMDASEFAPAEVSLDALIAFGHLFLEKYSVTDALGVFRDCLKINKAHPDALLGIALAKRYESNIEVETYSRAALKVNPNHTGALNLLAELSMEAEDYESALKAVDSALAVNPSSLDSLSLKAVIRYFQGDMAAFSELEKRVFSINRSYGRFYHLLAENLAARRKYHEAVDFSRKAVEIDSTLWPAYTCLGMNLTRIGKLEEGRKAIQRAFDGDPFNVWAYNSLELFDQMDGFAQNRSAHFAVRMSKEDEPVLGPYLLDLAEEAYDTLTKRYKFTPDGPLHIEVFPDHGGFAVRTLGLPGLAGALGVCFGKVIAMDSPGARKAGASNWGATLWHEFAHVMTLQMSNYNIPRWFSEGISVYEEHRARQGWGDTLTKAFVAAYKGGTLMKASDLNSGFVRPRSPEQIMFAYYQAGLFCEMIEEKYGFEKIRQALLLFAANRQADEVFQQTLGLSRSQLDDEYDRFLSERFAGLAVRLDAAASADDKESLLEELKGNPESFSANLRLGTLLRKEGAEAEAERHLKKAQKLFPEYVEQDNPYQQLGNMYLELKREEEALAEFTAWSRFDGAAIEPLLKAADIHRTRKNWDSAVNALKLSIFINPYDPEVLKKLGDAAMEAGKWGEAVTAYRSLAESGPVDPAGAHYSLARALLATGKKPEAKRQVLRALEIAPSYPQAQKLLLELSEAAAGERIR